jgi:hypothetical protein
MLGIIGQQSVIEDLPGDRIQAEIRLVEQGDFGPGGHPYNDSNRGMHASG